MPKQKTAKPERKVRTIVRVKSTDLAKAITALGSRSTAQGADQADVARALVLLSSIADGHKVKVVKSFDLEVELAKFDSLPLECDGMSRVLSFKLNQMGVKHIVKQGQLLLDGVRVVPIHQWIELSDGRFVDYRARMWAGKGDDIPHGVFNKADFKRMTYDGPQIPIDADEKLFKVLTTPIVPVPLTKADAPANPVVPAGQ
jgi:hypothetical protein